MIAQSIDWGSAFSTTSEPGNLGPWRTGDDAALVCVFPTTDSAKEALRGVSMKTANLDPAGKIAYPRPESCDGSDNRAIRLRLSGLPTVSTVPTGNEQPDDNEVDACKTTIQLHVLAKTVSDMSAHLNRNSDCRKRRGSVAVRRSHAACHQRTPRAKDWSKASLKLTWATREAGINTSCSLED